MCKNNLGHKALITVFPPLVPDGRYQALDHVLDQEQERSILPCSSRRLQVVQNHLALQAS